jgi:hypothetical protein
LRTSRPSDSRLLLTAFSKSRILESRITCGTQRTQSSLPSRSSSLETLCSASDHPRVSCHRVTDNKFALFLCENYCVIFIPKFEVSTMVLKTHRKLQAKTVRQMRSWLHHAFREALKTKAALFQWCQVVGVHVAYILKICKERDHQLHAWW